MVMANIHLIPLAVFLPLAGFLVNGLAGRLLKREGLIGGIASAAVGAGFVIGCMVLAELLALPPEARTYTITLFTWIAAGSLQTSVAYQVDPLSVTMLLIVTGVGFLIHLYAIGYMHGDRGFWRFFAYLNLFVFAMLNLIMADNFLLLFLGWEGVGLCSYLLIGFWYDRKFETSTTADAAKKAFIVNRIGDVGFLIGMFLIYKAFGSLQFSAVFGQAAGFPVGSRVIVAITLALFIGATGKSAQIPLFVWLPDAMAGPTPVSALIHAATMVTAGVYMVARCSLLYALAPVSLTVVAIIGACTALFAATIGLVQNDIKKILAYSTISQLGYMFLALGVGAFSAGIFHVMTHAFFKALLFLGAGSVIHAVHEEQNIQKMGGLKASLPITYWTFLAGSVAIAGIFPLSGFFSKDEILWRAFAGGHWVLWAMGLIGAALTAFYMFRLVTLTFEGNARWAHGIHPHEAPPTMYIPLIVLAVLSVVGGVLGIPASLGGGNAIEHWLEPVFQPALERIAAGGEASHTAEYLLMVLSVGVALSGIFLARRWYLKNTTVPDRLGAALPVAYKTLEHKYYVDEIYDAVVVTPVARISERFLWRIIDINIIDRLVNAIARGAGAIGRTVRFVQTGIAQSYALIFLLGVVVILGWILAR
jgi:NADH-quinone oxidoreductase subunit L